MSTGKVIQNYRITRFIGDGGMGTVWQAEHVLLGRQVAVKSLHGPLVRNPAIRERFKHEAATLAHLHHPCIVAMHDYIEDAEGAYLVMEYVEGMPLDDYIRDVTGPIPDAPLKLLFQQILEGFAYAHAKRVVHRDIKPGNFLITPDGRVKILDFGIAKIVGDGDRRLTKTGTNMGTVLYMSPEQVQGRSVDQRSDIYSLGVTLFQMATGRNPYSADMTEFYVYDQIVNHPLPPAREFYPGVSPLVEALIAKATAKDPEARFQDCGAFLAAMLHGMAPPEPAAPAVQPPPLPQVHEPAEQRQAGVPVEAPPAPAPAPEAEQAAPVPVESRPPTAPPPPEPRRRRGRGWLWALVLMALVGAGIGLGWKYLPFGGSGTALYVVPEDLHLRDKPTTKGKDLGLLPFGSQLKVLGNADGGWKEVEWKGSQGYVNGYYLLPFEEFQVIKHAMNEGMKGWLNKSYLRISLARYFHDAGLKADLPASTFQEVYGSPKGSAEVWKAFATAGSSQYNTVIRGLQLESGDYADAGRQPDNVVLLRSSKGHARIVAFRHEKTGESYESSVIATYDCNEQEEDWEIRIASADKLWSYDFLEKEEVLAKAQRKIYPILLANPKNDFIGVLLTPGAGKSFKRIEITKGF